MIYSNESLIRLFPKVPLFHRPKGSGFFSGGRNDPLARFNTIYSSFYCHFRPFKYGVREQIGNMEVQIVQVSRVSKLQDEFGAEF